MKTILVDAVNCFIIERDNKWVIFGEMYQLLQKYPNLKIILTGATDDKFVLYGIDKLPYEFFTMRHNPEKTNPEYYKILLSKYNLKPEEVIYFEHNIEAVQSAESVGIRSYFYDDTKEDLISLKNFLDENI